MNDLCLPRMEGANEGHSSLENSRIRIGRSEVKFGLPVSQACTSTRSPERAVDALLDERGMSGSSDRGFKSEVRYIALPTIDEATFCYWRKAA
jgi:hypothetical protein